MQPFLGDLLMGGIRLRHLSGQMVDIPAGHESIWSGHFSIDDGDRGLFEIGRPYMLVLDDGRTGRVVVTKLGESAHECAVRVEFRPAA